MMWKYSQSTGQIRQDTEVVGKGYSGKAEHKNNPNSQTLHNLGPIPVGKYQIQGVVDTPTHGPFVLPLAPDMNNQMFGRSGFLIHGDSIHEPGTASEGCIVMDYDIREQIWKSLDRDLEVTP